MRAAACAPISPRRLQASTGRGKLLSISLDKALPACGFQIAAELRSLGGGAKRPDQGAIYDLLANVCPLDQRSMRAEHARVFALQRAVRCFGVSLALLRRNLHKKA